MRRERRSLIQRVSYNIMLPVGFVHDVISGENVLSIRASGVSSGEGEFGEAGGLHLVPAVLNRVTCTAVILP